MASGNLNMKTPILLKLIKGFPCVCVAAPGSIKIIHICLETRVGGQGEGGETHAYSETFTKGYISFHLGVRGVPPRDISSGWLYCQLQFNVITVLKRKLDHFIRWIMFSSVLPGLPCLKSFPQSCGIWVITPSRGFITSWEHWETQDMGGERRRHLIPALPSPLTPDCWYKCVAGPLGSQSSRGLAVMVGSELSSELISGAWSGAA